MTESDAVDIVEIAINRHASDLTTKAMALVALLKLSSRFPSCSEYDLFFKLLLSTTAYLKLEFAKNQFTQKHKLLGETLWMVLCLTGSVTLEPLGSKCSTLHCAEIQHLFRIMEVERIEPMAN